MALVLNASLVNGKTYSTKTVRYPSLTKDCIPGKTYRLFIRTTKEFGSTLPDVVIASTVGRKLDRDICGIPFYAFSESQISISEDDKISDKTELERWSRVMSVIRDAQCAHEKEDVMATAVAAAEKLGSQVDQRELDERIMDIDLKYHGKKGTDNVPTVYATVKPAIGGLNIVYVAEILRVPLDETGKPIYQDAVYCIRELSEKLKNQLINIATKSEFNDNNKDYIELQFTFGNASDANDRSAAGRNSTYSGVVSTLSLETVYPDLWEKQGKALVDNLICGERDATKAAELILSHDYNMTCAGSVNDIIQSIKSWCSKNLILFSSIDYSADKTKYAAVDLLESGIVDRMPKVLEKLRPLVAEGASTSTTPATAESPAPTAAAVPQTEQFTEAVDTMAGQSTEPVVGDVPVEAEQVINIFKNGPATTVNAIADINIGGEDGDDDDLVDLV